MKNTKEYKIDFVIPQGPTGPEGIQGPTGPVGPASLSALIYSEFVSSAKEGNLNIYQNTILPKNTSIFKPTTSEIEITEPGTYEFIISGALGGLNQNEVLSISMIVNHENGANQNIMLASVVANSEQEYFSQTMLLTFQEKSTIKIYFRKNNMNYSALETLSLLIKKLSF